MKILHCADLHLDSPFSGLDARTGESRREEQRELFRSLVCLVRNRRVDLLLIAGDLFDSGYTSAKTVKFVADKKNSEYHDLRARNLVENETFIFVGLLMLRDAMKDAAREVLAERYILDAVADFERNYLITLSDDMSTIDRHRSVIDY